MSSSLIIRAARPTLARASAKQVSARGVHIENKLYEIFHTDSAHLQNMPFDYRNKRAFGFKLAAYMATGFAIPFVAAAYQISKSQSG
ncbi:hypothetical protein FRC03_007109 [Tulasnella sp. 419]|nr:hypothetical protein FRC03_007109 [Tulasnella sp. 419]